MVFEGNVWTLVGGFVTLFSSLLHIIPAIGLLAECDFKFATPLNLLYVTYLYKPYVCGNQHIEEIFPPEYNLTHLSTQIIFPSTAKWRRMCAVLLEFYVVLDLCLVLASICLIYGVFVKAKVHEKPAVTYFWPWIFIMLLTTGLDIGLGITFGVQYFKLVKFEDWLDLMGAEYVLINYNTSPQLTMAIKSAPLIMVFYFTRGLELVGFNIVLLFRNVLNIQKVFIYNK